jgi:hypothetical protein
MIRVAPAPEPSDFDAKVRQPGLPKVAAFKAGTLAELPDLWKRCLDQLYGAYKGLCCYSAMFIYRASGIASVEHFAPKSRDPDLTYEWSNYRLASSTINGWKSNYEDVLDPFDIADGWFALVLPDCEVVPGVGLTEARRKRVAETIARLKLNHAKLKDDRAVYYSDYRSGDTNFAFLRRRAPFLALELQRQGLRRAGD